MMLLRCRKYHLLSFLISWIIGCSSLSGQNTTVNPTEISFDHEGNRLHGWFYKAQGKGPFTTLILLHGSVGQDGDIFNLGQKLSKEGFNIMTYSYPGLWKSEGNITHVSALGSVQSAINFVKSEYSMPSFETDTSDIILLGYSYGGGMALIASTFDSSIKKVITIAPGDLSLTAEYLNNNPDARISFEQMIDRTLSDTTVGRGTTGKQYVEELLTNRDKYNIKRYSGELAEKKLLFLVGWLDSDKRIERDVLPLFRELQSNGAENVKIVAFETNHSFSNVQTELADAIINWLRAD